MLVAEGHSLAMGRQVEGARGRPACFPAAGRPAALPTPRRGQAARGVPAELQGAVRASQVRPLLAG